MEELSKIVSTILTQLRYSGKLPTRLNDEDFHDLHQEGMVAGLAMLPHFDAQRGSMRSYMGRSIARAILAYAWKTSNLGVTGGHDGVQIWSDQELPPLPDDDGLHPDAVIDASPEDEAQADDLAMFFETLQED